MALSNRILVPEISTHVGHLVPAFISVLNTWLRYYIVEGGLGRSSALTILVEGKRLERKKRGLTSKPTFDDEERGWTP